MDVWAIIPVKSLSTSKRRLAHVLSSEQRARLMRNLLSHVLSVVRQTPEISRTLVISTDPEVWSIARAFAAEIVEEIAPPDLNSAAARGLQLAAKGGASGVLILPADLPFVSSADIRLMLETGSTEPYEPSTQMTMVSGTLESGARVNQHNRPVVSICSDRRGNGTNAFFLEPPAPFDFLYGPHSLEQHIREALQRDYLVRLVNCPGLQFDLDTGEDWQALGAEDQFELADASATQRLIH